MTQTDSLRYRTGLMAHGRRPRSIDHGVQGRDDQLLIIPASACCGQDSGDVASDFLHHQPAKGGYDSGVELSSCVALDLLERGLQGPSRTIRPIGHHCVKRVRDGYDSGAERNLVASKSLGIAFTVVSLVVAFWHIGE